MIAFKDMVFPAILTGCFIYLFDHFLNSPDAQTMDKVRRVDQLEAKLKRYEKDLSRKEEELQLRENELVRQREVLAQEKLEMEQSNEYLRYQINQCRRETEKAHGELIGARQRYKRKLNKLREQQGERDVFDRENRDRD